MSSDTWGNRPYPNRNDTHPMTTTTTTTISSLGNNHDRRPHPNDIDHRRTNRRRRSRSKSYSKSRSRSRSRSRSINDSLSRSPSPNNRRNDRNRKRTNGNTRPYHARRPRRNQRELPYPSRSRSNSRSVSRSKSRSHSPSFSNESDDERRHRRHRKSRNNTRDNRYKHQSHGHYGRGNRGRHGSHHRHSRGDNMSSKHKNDDKAPVSFKEFTNTMLEDDVTANEAQKRYEKYLQRFSKSDDVLFFEAHKDEEWFQERYDPIIIEKSIELRRQSARKNYWKFYEDFLNDKVPEIHDNVDDYKQESNPIKTELSDIENEESTEKEKVTMTTIGGEEAASSSDHDQQQSMMDVDIVRSVPNDGKLRLPKYADFMYKDDYEPNYGKYEYSNKYDKNECYQNSIFIQGIPLHIQRDKIQKPFSKFEGFEKLILSDPIRNTRKVRYGWVTFDSQDHCRLALRDVSEQGLNGYALTSQYFMNLLPKQKSKRRPKFSPPESLYPHRVQKDVLQCLKCCKKFDFEAGIKGNPLFVDGLLNALSDIYKLNLMILYLRRIHFLCYYCGKHFLSEEHMFARCSGMHERKVPADISLAMSGNIDIDSNNDGNIVKKAQTNWEKEVDERIGDVLNYSFDDRHTWMERKELKMLEKNVKKVCEGKFRCTICSKLFKAQVYVTKHIKNKHGEEIKKYTADQRLRTMFENYRRDRDRLTLRSFEDLNGDKNGNGDYHHRRMGNKRMNNHHQNGNNNNGRGHGRQSYNNPMMRGSPLSNDVSGIHPERASIIAGAGTKSFHSNSAQNNQRNVRPQRYEPPPPVQQQQRREDNNNNNGGNGAPFEDPYGRKMPVHFQDAVTRTRRSYKQVDIEFPVDEVEEEIDYGFGDFVKNPTKFNL